MSSRSFAVNIDRIIKTDHLLLFAKASSFGNGRSPGL